MFIGSFVCAYFFCVICCDHCTVCFIMPGNRKPAGARRGSSERKSRSRSPSKNCMQSTGNLGSSRVILCQPKNMTTKEFCDLVQRRFKKNPSIYHKFGQIVKQLGMMSDPLDRLELVKQMITLFDGHPDLILNMNPFLPEEYCIEIQNDAVVIKVFEQFGEASLVDTGHSRPMEDSHAPVSELGTSVPSISYIMNVKKVFADRPEVYTTFMALLKHYHSKKADELHTINRIVALFKTRPDLVLGFNDFLPPGYSLHMYEKSGYVLEYPNPEGVGTLKVKIRIDEKQKKKK